MTRIQVVQLPNLRRTAISIGRAIVVDSLVDKRMDKRVDAPPTIIAILRHCCSDASVSHT